MNRAKADKIKDNLKRILVLLRESSYNDWPEILWSLRPAARRRGVHFVKFLEKKGLIKTNFLDKKINFLDFSFYYEANDLAALMADLVSIWGNDHKYFYNTFIKNKVYFFEGPYESGKVALEIGDHVVDAGANLGLFTIFAGKKIGSSGVVYAFEPVKITRSLLERNVRINGLDNVIIKSLALGDSDKMVNFNIPSDLGSSSAVFSAEHLNSVFSEKVAMKTLDSLVESGEIKQIDFIKADIEGSERDLLIGSRVAINKFHPRLSICTYHRPDDREALTSLLLNIEPRYKVSYSPTKMFAYYEGSGE